MILCRKRIVDKADDREEATSQLEILCLDLKKKGVTSRHLYSTLVDIYEKHYLFDRKEEHQNAGKQVRQMTCAL